MEIPRIPLNTSPEKEWSYEEYEASAPTTSGEAAEAAWDLSMPDTAVGLLARKLSMDEFSEAGTAPISPEEANKLYPDMRIPFREPINPYAAQMLYDREQEQRNLQNVIARGPTDVWSKSKQFGAGLFAHLMDPLEFGAGALSGMAIGGLAVRGAFGVRASIATDLVAQGARVPLGVRLGVNAGEAILGGVVENTAQEAAIAAVEGQEGLPNSRTTGEVFGEIGAASLAAGMFGVGIKEASFHMRGLMRRLNSTSPEADLAVMRNIVQAIETDVEPDFKPIMKALAQETSITPQEAGKPASAGYEFVPVMPDTIRGKKFYLSSLSKVDDFRTSQLADLGDSFGFGTHISDNPAVANAAAARSMADSPGAVHEVAIKGEVTPLVLDAAIPPDSQLAKSMNMILEQIDESLPLELTGASVRDVLDTIRNAVDEEIVNESAFDVLKEELKSLGYNALIGDGRKRLGFDHSPHNHLILLDDSLLESKGAFDPDASVVKQPSAQDIEMAATKLQDPNSKFFVDTKARDASKLEVKEYLDGAREDFAKLREITDQSLEEIDSLTKQGFYTDAEADAMKSAIRESRARAEQESILLKAFKDCAGA